MKAPTGATWLTACLLGLGLAGCSPPNADDASELACVGRPNDTSVPVFPVQSVAEACAGMFGCSCEEYPFESESACVAAEEASFTQMESFALENDLTVDEGCFIAQLDYNRFGCDPPALTVEQVERMDWGLGTCPSCQAVFGTKSVGEACNRYLGGSDCSQGLLCGAHSNVPGAEEEFPPSFCYDPCAPPTVDVPCPAAGCGETMFCAPNLQFHMPGHVCKPRSGREVDPCNGVPTDFQCGPGLFCDEAADEQAMCESLDPDEECHVADEPCPSGSYCDAGSCVPKSNNGETCTSHTMCESEVCFENTCVPPRALGETCGSDIHCESGLHCEQESCVPLSELGEPCESQWDCIDGAVCNPEHPDDETRICVPRPVPGCPCDYLGNCAPAFGDAWPLPQTNWSDPLQTATCDPDGICQRLPAICRL